MRHTNALTYSRWERLVFRLTGRWPQRVVDRRLDALSRDEREAKAVTDNRTWIEDGEALA